MPTAELHLLSEHHFLFSGLMARYRPHLLLAGMCLAVGFCLLAFDFADLEGIAFWVLLILGASALWLVPALIGYQHSIKKVGVYEEGIAWTASGREEYHGWDEVREVFRGERKVGPLAQQAEITLVFQKHPPIVFSQSLSDFFPLATLVEAIVTERLLPRYRQALDQEGAVFGPVVLRPQGIRINERDLTWQEVEHYAISNGGLVITHRHAENAAAEEFAPFAAIPNYLIMLELLEELGKWPDG